MLLFFITMRKTQAKHWKNKQGKVYVCFKWHSNFRQKAYN